MKILREWDRNGVKYRLVGKVRKPDDLADISVEYETQDSDGRTYWRIHSQDVIWSRAAITKSNERAHEYDELSADQHLEGLLFDMLMEAE